MQKTLALAALALAAVAVPAAGSAGERSATAPSARAGAEMQVATLIVRNTRFGRMLFDGRGRALYAFTRDRRGGPSTCYGACAAAWPVYFAKGKPVAGRGVNKSLIGTTRRRGGRLQLTYNGWPLYYYAHERAGQVLCQNVDQFGGLWLVVRPSGQLVR
jgi:predicted lipoprotein with Yx(FWY)xxD motif